MADLDYLDRLEQEAGITSGEGTAKAEEGATAPSSSGVSVTLEPTDEGYAATVDGLEVGEDGRLGVKGTALDIAKGVVGGVRDGVQETLETVQWAGESAGNALTGGKDLYWTRNDGFEWLSVEDVRGRDDIPDWQTQDLFGETLVLPEVSDQETVGGSLVRGTTQFLTGYAMFAKALKVGKAATSAGNYGRAMVAGSATDFVSFDAHEARFSDFLRDNVGLQDPITEYLSADEDDSVLEGKFKNAVEGLGLGLAADGLFRLAKAFKGAKRIQVEEGDEAAREFFEEQLELFDEVTDPNLRSTGAGPDRVRVIGREPVDDAALKAETEEYLEQAGAVTRNNAAARVTPEVPRDPVDVGEFQKAIDYEIGLVRAGSYADPEATRVGKLFNFDTMDSDVSTKDMLNMASEFVPPDLIKDDTTFKAILDGSYQFLSDAVDVSPGIIDRSLRSLAKSKEQEQSIVVAGKMLVQSLSREVEDLAYKISQGVAVDADYDRMVRLQARLLETAGDLKSVIKGSAQTTAAGRIHTIDAVTGKDLATEEIMRQLDESLQHAGGRDAIKDLADEILARRRAGQGNSSVMRVVVDRQRGGFWQVANEVRINGLLSGPKTHMINLISNSMQAFLLPTEKILGGAMMRRGDIMREGFDQYAGLFLASRDALKAAKMAFWKGRNLLDPEASILEAEGVDFRAIKSTSDNALVRNMINGIGTTIRLPSRGLLAGDELFKQLNYRANLYARLHREARNLMDTGKLTKDDAAQWVADRMKTAIAPDGQAKSGPDLDFAREATFTNELRKGSFARGIQNLTNQHPWMKLIIPFVRTPTNIIVAGVQRTPLLRRLSKTLDEQLKSSDPSVVARAKGKIAMGHALWGAAITAAMSGTITGSGPVDPRAKARLLETGWRPYSFKVPTADGGVKYVEYNRADPFAMFFGIAADVADIGAQVDEATLEELAKASLVALANNIGSKTYLQGIVDAADAVANPNMSLSRYINNQAATFLPMSSALREARKYGDPAMRDVQTILDSIKNTVPGWSQSLPARRSWITGEPIIYPRGVGADLMSPVGDAMGSMMPFAQSEDKQDPVLDELARLGEGFGGNPLRSMDGVDLTPEQYEMFLELHGKVRAPGTKRTMYQELERLFQSPTYDTTAPVGDPEIDIRIKRVRRVISAYRRLAKAELLQRHPDLQRQILLRRMEQRDSARSSLSGITELGE